MLTRTFSVVVLAWLVLLPALAHAEGFADLFLGGSTTTKSDFDITFDDGSTLTGEQEFKTSLAAGGRAGYWWGPFGLNLDFLYFRPEFDPDEVTLIAPPFTLVAKSDLDIIGIGINAMLRFQALKDERVPEGRLQPYIFAGPTLFLSTLDIEATLTEAGVGTATASDSDTDASIGLTAGAGLTYMFTQNIGAFAEYRFTYVQPTFEITGSKTELTLNTHHLLAGVSFRF